MSEPLNKFSSKITQPRSQGASQAMLYATGMSDDDMKKAQVGIASVWYEGNPCNMHLLDLANRIKEGVEKVDLFGTILGGLKKRQRREREERRRRLAKRQKRRPCRTKTLFLVIAPLQKKVKKA